MDTSPSWYVITLWYCGSEDIIVLICHMISQDQLTKESKEILMVINCPSQFSGHTHCGMWSCKTTWLYVKQPLIVSHDSAKFGGHWHCGCGDIIIFIYHVTLQVHVLRRSCDLRTGAPKSRSSFCQVWWPQGLC